MPLIVAPGEHVDHELEAFYRQVRMFIQQNFPQLKIFKVMSNPFLLAKLEDGIARGNGLMRLQRPDSDGLQPQLPSGSQARQLPAPPQTLSSLVAGSKKAGKRK